MDEPLPNQPPRRRWLPVVEVALIVAVFFVHASWSAPDTNEPQYLGKAKHYWDPDWCAGDFFLATADAHTVFYWTFGWLSLWLPLPALAWTGRFLTWVLLAWAWRRLSWAVLPKPWLAVLTAALYVMLAERAHMAGEWVVGGVEAKGFAYVLVFLGIEAIVRGKWNLGWLLLGGASAFHVLVGGWSVVAAGIAWLASSRDRPSLASMAPGLAGGFVLSLLGLYPALLLTTGAEPQIVRQANELYVNERLPHHLAIEKFKEGFVGRHVLLGALWIVLCIVTPADAGSWRLCAIVAGAMGIAATGWLIGVGCDFGGWLWRQGADTTSGADPFSGWKAGLLRYYWFRMSDSLLPLGAAITAVQFVTRPGFLQMRTGRVALAACLLAPALYLTGRLLDASLWDAPRSDKALVYGDWVDVCDWAATQTPPGTMFLTPRSAATFKWYAGRPEVVSWKDVPQDAASIVAWYRRFRTVHEQPKKHFRSRWIDSFGELPPDRVQQLAQEFQAQYAIVAKLQGVSPLAGIPVVYENSSYAVCDVRQPPPEPPPLNPN